MSMQLRRYPLWLKGSAVHQSGENEVLSVLSPATGVEVSRASLASELMIEELIQASLSAFHEFRRTSRFARAEVLLEISRQISTRYAEAFEDLIVEEAGKPRVLARAEVQRAAVTFRLASEEARRWGTETLPLDGESAAKGYSDAEIRKVPRGVVFGITPFNFPLNLAAHKIAPALAVGASVILKPPHQAPGACDLLLQIWEGVVKDWNSKNVGPALPLAALQLVHAEPRLLEKIVVDPRVQVISFTGSDSVGWKLRGLGYKKQVLLELGGNASVIVHQDADLDLAVSRCLYGAFAYSGQICISVQKIWVHDSVYEVFKKRFIEGVKALQVGAPESIGTWVGPLIDIASADRVRQWRDEAIRRGATLVAQHDLPIDLGPQYVAPFILEAVPSGVRFECDELFGPGVALEVYRSIPEVIEQINQSRFGLQGGVFTQDSRVVQYCFEEWEVGGLLVNEVPTWRVDSLPYGGTKDSGTGREGPRFAMEDFCELRVKVEKRI